MYPYPQVTDHSWPFLMMLAIATGMLLFEYAMHILNDGDGPDGFA